MANSLLFHICRICLQAWHPWVARSPQKLRGFWVERLKHQNQHWKRKKHRSIIRHPFTFFGQLLVIFGMISNQCQKSIHPYETMAIWWKWKGWVVSVSNLQVPTSPWRVKPIAKLSFCRRPKRESQFQRTIGCTPNSVPIVCIVFSRRILCNIPKKISHKEEMSKDQLAWTEAGGDAALERMSELTIHAKECEQGQE